jgi:hypothetical protein
MAAKAPPRRGQARPAKPPNSAVAEGVAVAVERGRGIVLEQNDIILGDVLAELD